MSKLKIIIEGTAGSGKTTVAKIVSDALAAWGFKPTVQDQEPLLPSFSERQEKRIRSLVAKNPSVQIRVIGRKNGSLQVPEKHG